MSPISIFTGISIIFSLLLTLTYTQTIDLIYHPDSEFVVNKNYNKFSSMGVVLQDLGKMTPSHGSYILAIPINVNEYIQNFEITRAQMANLTNTVGKFPRLMELRTVLNRTVLRLQDYFDMVSTNFQLMSEIFHDIPRERKAKRALFEFIGQIGKELFGIAMNKDLQGIKRDNIWNKNSMLKNYTCKPRVGFSN